MVILGRIFDNPTVFNISSHEGRVERPGFYIINVAVSQGSILRSMMARILINDISDVTSFQFRYYIDDIF